MSDWLERELTRGLSPVAAPDQLRVRLGLAPAAPWVFPRAACAVALAIVLIVGGGYVASRTPAFDLRPQAAGKVRADSLSSGPRVQLASARLMRCDRPDAAGFAVPSDSFKATVVLAHAAPAPEATHPLAPDSGCRLCHSL